VEGADGWEGLAVILKPKRRLRFRARRAPLAEEARRDARPAMGETKRIYLGTVTVEPGETVAFSIPPAASPAEIAAALRKAEIERAEAQARETARLHEMFLEGESHDDQTR
jgi:hypothetical protein